MSGSFNTFVKSNLSIEEFVSVVERITGHKFIENDTADWKLYDFWILGLDLAIYESKDEFEDDQGIEFSKYDFTISLTPTSRISVDYRDSFAIIFSTVLAEIISKELKTECLVIKNMQTLLQSFQA